MKVNSINETKCFSVTPRTKCKDIRGMLTSQGENSELTRKCNGEITQMCCCTVSNRDILILSILIKYIHKANGAEIIRHVAIRESSCLCQSSALLPVLPEISPWFHYSRFILITLSTATSRRKTTLSPSLWLRFSIITEIPI